MWKKIIILQFIVCMVFSAAETMCPQPLKNKGREAVAAVCEIPGKVAEIIQSGVNAQEYGLPIDKESTEQVVPVYAVAGGRVAETGENNGLGKYIMIKHEKASSIYGNCCEVYVKTGQHVRKGQIIGTFDNTENVDFYYQLSETEK